jgi:hypothetical protein
MVQKHITSMALLAVLLALSLFLGGPARAKAQPVIYSIEGKFADGQTVLISGDMLGSKPEPKPLVFADFESSIDPSPLGRRTQWDDIQNIEWDPDEGFNGSGCARATNDSGVWALRLDRNGGESWTENGEAYYIYRKIKQNFLVPDGSEDAYGVNWKSWRMWNDIGHLPYPDIYASPSNGRVYVEHNGEADTGYWGDFGITTTDWFTEELFILASSAPDTPDGYLEIRYNNVTVASGPIMTLPGDSPGYMHNNFVVHGVAANKNDWRDPYQWSTSNRYWADDVYVDNSWARVILANGPTLDESTRIEPQIPADWADQSILVTVRTSDFAPDSVAYLYVVDASGTPSDAFPVVIAPR